MELFTVGKVFLAPQPVPLWHNPDETIDPDLGDGTRFRLVFVQSGSGLLELENRQVVLMAPALLCLNETEQARLNRSHNLRSQALYFHPSFINGSFDFETIRSPEAPPDWNVSDWQDRYLLAVFTRRGPEDRFLFQLGPDTIHQVARLFQSIGQVLDIQQDFYWPCRARSYLLELLFLVDRLRMQPEPELAIPAAELPPPCAADPDESPQIEDLILYLHTHYSEKITLDQLCREFHSNRTTLSERFRLATGQTLMAYLAQLRIRVAAIMLRDTTLPVGEVALRTGFVDLTHFGRAFRKSTGEAPSTFRARHCWLLQ